MWQGFMDWFLRPENQSLCLGLFIAFIIGLAICFSLALLDKVQVFLPPGLLGVLA